MSYDYMDFSVRDARPGVSSLFIERWSPRAFEPYDMPQRQLARLIDAARWSPSAFNTQPWRFKTSTPGNFAEYVKLLVDANQSWAKNASVIGFLIGNKHHDHDGSANACFAFDCGSAWMAMTLQARMEGLHTHGMAGIRYEKATEYFGLDSERQQLLMAFAIGKAGGRDQLTDEQREQAKPSPRKSLQDIWHA